LRSSDNTWECDECDCSVAKRLENIHLAIVRRLPSDYNVISQRSLGSNEARWDWNRNRRWRRVGEEVEQGCERWRKIAEKKRYGKKERLRNGDMEIWWDRDERWN
jgi:hypothetical protein